VCAIAGLAVAARDITTLYQPVCAEHEDSSNTKCRSVPQLALRDVVVGILLRVEVVTGSNTSRKRQNYVESPTSSKKHSGTEL
jgi:hypothetical protein